MWRALETEPRQILNGHEEGNLGNKPRTSLRAAAPALDPTNTSAKVPPRPVGRVLDGFCPVAKDVLGRRRKRS